MKWVRTAIAAAMIGAAVASLSDTGVPEPSDVAVSALTNRLFALSLMAEEQYGMPMEKRPKMLIEVLGSPDAWADCDSWTITLDQTIVVRDLDYVLTELLPHEYAHMVRCHLAGGVGPEPHDILWATISHGLGGPDIDQKWRGR